MADPTPLPKIAKLIEAQRDLLEKLDAVTHEIEQLLAGKPGIGATLKRLEAAFERVHEARYHGVYVWNFVKDRAQMKRLLRTLDVEDIEGRMLVYLGSDEPFYTKARHSFPVFVAAVNGLVNPSQSHDLDDDVQATKRRIAESRR